MEWKTPERKESNKLIISTNEQSSHREVLQKVKNATKEIWQDDGLRNIIPLRNGKIVLQCTSKDQQTRMSNVLNKSKEILKEMNDKKPTIMITGVMNGYSDEEIIGQLTNENEELNNTFGSTLKQRMRVLSRKTCRNEYEENIKIETDHEVAKYLLKRGYAYMDMVRLRIEEIIDVSLCFNCHKYGHVAKYCKDQTICHKCGENHRGSECKTLILDCPNCKINRIQKDLRRHTAIDTNCPIYGRKVAQIRQTVNYGQNTTQR
ncbi:uncharacterized protein LOC123321084 [Coccinella septempunctata]|uniref:uncharacterized protein LOC123321084 n=1 Tax=Coccinella septempunctata TaxID=41139 RepID=UPI001D096B2D|nr:uncharacterized protein LOC123321084 [Coccinella septempunctata]